MILLSVIAQLGVYYTSIALYNLVCNMQKENTRVQAPILQQLILYKVHLYAIALSKAHLNYTMVHSTNTNDMLLYKLH